MQALQSMLSNTEDDEKMPKFVKSLEAFEAKAADLADWGVKFECLSPSKGSKKRKQK